MTRRILSVFGAALVALILVGFNHTQQGGGSSENLKLRPFPSTLSPNLPYDVDETMIDQMMAMVHPKNGGEYSAEDESRVITAQREFDILSWQAFLALNWPHKTYDVAESTVNDPHGEPLWSYWVPKEKIFLPNGAKPDYPWDAEKAAQNIAEHGLKLTMVKAAWRQKASATDNFQAFSGPLVDQNGKWARYEAMVNPEEFDYIYSNTLYSLDGQIAFSERDIDHNEVKMPVNEGKQKRGAIEIKLAWKELGPNDDPSRFYTKKVRVKVSGPAGNGQDEYRTIPAGLVGMHIAMHTRSSPEWIWSTFEQIDNVRQNPLAGC